MPNFCADFTKMAIFAPEYSAEVAHLVERQLPKL